MAELRDRAAAGRWIFEYRNKIGLTQDEFRVKWHINRTRLVEIEHGNLIPLVEEIERLKQAFTLSFNDWLGLRGAYQRTTGHLLRLDDSDYTVDVDTPEQQFVAAITDLPTVQIGNLRVPARLIPTSLWNKDRQTHSYADDLESSRQIEIEWTGSAIPDEALTQLVREMSEMLREHGLSTLVLPEEHVRALTNTYALITEEKSNPYPRVVAMPDIVKTRRGHKTIHKFRVQIGRGKYGIAAIEERRAILPPLPTAIALRARYNLQAFAIRVAYIGQADSKGRQWVEFQQRRETNATWKKAWDVGAAGYVDYLNHRDPKDKTRVSVWQSSCDEICKELDIPDDKPPHRDNCRYFGFAKDEPTGHLILLGYCRNDFIPDPNRPPAPLVRAYGRCELTPEAVASFLVEKEHWVPSAVLTLYLTLEAEGFDRKRIVRAFSSLEGKLIFDAYRGIE